MGRWSAKLVRVGAETTDTTGEPDLVRAARQVASAAGFTCSCDDRVGQLLSVLAAGVPLYGRILELGMGAGVGTAWLSHGLGQRTDVDVVTVESDLATAALARQQPWPAYVTLLVEDAVALLPTLGRFDLIFADAQGGKWDRPELTIAALKRRGVLVVDDMTPTESWGADQAAKQAQVRQILLEHPELVSCELDWATGVVLSVKRG